MRGVVDDVACGINHQREALGGSKGVDGRIGHDDAASVADRERSIEIALWSINMSQSKGAGSYIGEGQAGRQKKNAPFTIESIQTHAMNNPIPANFDHRSTCHAGHTGRVQNKHWGILRARRPRGSPLLTPTPRTSSLEECDRLTNENFSQKTLYKYLFENY